MAAWDRQPKEPPKAYEHFCRHRDAGPQRHLRATSEICGISYLVIQQESATHKWTERCAAYDAHLDQIARAAYTKELEKQAKLRAQAYNALMGKSLEALKNAPQARLGEIATAMKVAAEGMRLEAGLATEKVDVEDVTPLTDDERATRLAELLQRGRDRRGLPAPDAGGAGGSRPAPSVH